MTAPHRASGVLEVNENKADPLGGWRYEACDNAGSAVYRVHACSSAPPLSGDWNDPAWRRAETAEVCHFRPESSAHRPETLVRLLYAPEALHGMFLVRDRYVRCIRTDYGDQVFKDSCVEFFLQPKPDRGYINFEFNCGGARLCRHITDWTLENGTWRSSTAIPPVVGNQVLVKTSLPSVVDPEISEPISWTLQFYLPLTVLEPSLGPLTFQAGQVWRGNFFKCATEVSHPHWAAWSPVDEFNFHLPRCFGWLLFQP
jgi:hypothetical protein